MIYTNGLLKWAGGKFRALPSIFQVVPQSGDTLIEPFVGSACVAMNTSYKNYILADQNKDLINLYMSICKNPEQVFKDAQQLFTPDKNEKDAYLTLRRQFNYSSDPYERSILFLYLNRHCFNGLMRYNKKLGHFNTSFGKYKCPKIHEAPLQSFAKKFENANFIHSDFRELKIPTDVISTAVIYCDPPYIPQSRTASFVSYTQEGFEPDDHDQLNNLCKAWSSAGASVYVSNADAPLLGKHYETQNCHRFHVRRSISQKGDTRCSTGEVIIAY